MERNDRVEVMTRSRFPDGFRILKGKQEYVTYIDHSSLRVWYSETPWQYESHWHSAVEVILPLLGEVMYTVEDQVYHVQSNEVLIVPPNRIHSLSMEKGSSRYLLLFEPDNLFNMRDMSLVEPTLKSPVYLTGSMEAQTTVRSLLMQVVNCYERRRFLWNSMCYSYLLQMYVCLGQMNEAADLRRLEARGRHIDPEIVESARLFIEQNYMRDIDLDDVSAFTGFSRCYFSRVFKQQLGISFSEYLRNRRVMMASELLVHSREPIRQIAMDVGFGSVATFNRVFRDVKHCTPSSYRKIYADLPE